ncbi:DUF1080 domain-containing protein [Segetibacter sp.]|jgi:hypothetical protein|uniref:3-keto-disaccharide hydrolase n=1 Tax=Segetibacter sp. TaxID=2231182 RepID=UPI0026043036|nr:DUF1080 domain-containing protein [Segetibacter sp.]MCW3082081.1 glycosyl hydrolase [Segetibacter sp.]
MRHFLFVVIGVVLILNNSSAQKTSLSMQDNSLSTQEKSEGWKLLFDGKTTNGWHSYGYSTVANAWNIDNGSLHLDVADRKNWPANESKDILTNEEYDNFHLKVDWKLAKKGNSGIIVYVHEDKAKYRNTYETGPEMQVLDNAGHADAKIPKHRAGDLYDLISSSSEPVKPAEEWNHAEIMCKDGKLQFFLNGVSIVTTTMWNDSWEKMIAGSKFKSMPGFGTFKKGKIALQEHGEEVWFKNIKIRKL